MATTDDAGSMVSDARPATIRRPRLSVLVEALAWTLVAAAPALWLGPSWRWLAQLGHLRVHLAVGVLLGAGFAVPTRRRALLVASLVAAALLWSPVLEVWAGDAPAVAVGSDVTIAQLNVHTENSDKAASLDWLRSTDADVLVLLEVDDAWLQALAPLAPAYPHKVQTPRPDNFGVAIWSRLPLRDTATLELTAAAVPTVRALVQLDRATSLLLFAAHPNAPITPRWTLERDLELLALAHATHDAIGAVALVGDLNVTPWSPEFRALLASGGLRDANAGHGPMGTWPAQLPAGKIALDHCLVSAGIGVLARDVGPDVGSDHRGVVTRLRVAPAPQFAATDSARR